MYSITRERDGEVFTSQVTILGIPLWIPQSRAELPREIVGEVVDVTLLPPNEEAGYKEEREALIFRTKTTHWVVPIASKVYERQFEEMRKPVIGDKLMISFDGKAKKNKKPGFQPANLFTVSFFDAKATAALPYRVDGDGVITDKGNSQPRAEA